jgi:Kef-type K+ transport system membrane component KefB
MAHRDLLLLYLQLGVMLAFAMAGGQAARRFNLPAVAGELLAGIVLGPTVLGLLAPHLHAWLFGGTGAAASGREAVTRLGVLFFVFVAGMEVDLKPLREKASRVIWTSLAGIIAPLGLGFGLVMLLPSLWAPHARGSLPALGLFIGTALSISALPVISRILIDLDLLKRELGAVIMTAATVNDLVGWLLFQLNLANFSPGGISPASLLLTAGGVLGCFALTLTVGRVLGQRLLRWLRAGRFWPRSFIAVCAVLALAGASVAEGIGIHAVFGAFLMGVALAPNSHERNSGHEAVYQFVTNFFAPVYFVSIGIMVDFARNFNLALVTLVLLVACLGKVLGGAAGARCGGMPPREAWAVGFGLNARGAIEMILATVALECGLIDAQVFVALIVMALVTSVLSGPVLQRLMAREG